MKKKTKKDQIMELLKFEFQRSFEKAGLTDDNCPKTVRTDLYVTWIFGCQFYLFMLNSKMPDFVLDSGFDIFCVVVLESPDLPPNQVDALRQFWDMSREFSDRALKPDGDYANLNFQLTEIDKALMAERELIFKKDDTKFPVCNGYN